jgi:hypothetical protein
VVVTVGFSKATEAVGLASIGARTGMEAVSTVGSDTSGPVAFAGPAKATVSRVVVIRAVNFV